LLERRQFTNNREEARVLSPSRNSFYKINSQVNINDFDGDTRTSSPTLSNGSTGSDETKQQEDSDYPLEMKELMGKYPFSFPPVKKDKVREKARYAACWLEELFGVSSKERRDNLEEMIVNFFDPEKSDAKWSPTPVIEDTTEQHSTTLSAGDKMGDTESESEDSYERVITALVRKNRVDNPSMGFATALGLATEWMAWFSGFFDESNQGSREEFAIELFGLEEWMEREWIDVEGMVG
jgi:hypothetical protein